MKNNPFIEKSISYWKILSNTVKESAFAHVSRLKKWSTIESELSPEERTTEKKFFISIFIIGSFFFVSASSATYLEYEDVDFWPTTDVLFEVNDDFLLAEDGFFGKTSIPTIGDVDRSEIANVVSYEIQSGDTVDLIASKFGITEKTLKENNSIADPSALKTGEVLKILPVDGFLYEIKRGDNLSTIAKYYNIDEDTLKKQNHIEKKGLIAGNHLILPGASKPTPRPTPVYVAQNNTNRTSSPSGRTTASPSNKTVAYTAPRSGKRYSWPVVERGTLTQGYHYGHYGIDIWGANQPGIKAISSGTVIRAVYTCGPRSYGCAGGYGNVVVIDHGNGVKGLYAHNAKVYVSVGEYVSAGQVIAKMGNSGNTRGRTGIHLHFELTINGRKVNPLGYL